VSYDPKITEEPPGLEDWKLSSREDLIAKLDTAIGHFHNNPFINVDLVDLLMQAAELLERDGGFIQEIEDEIARLRNPMPKEPWWRRLERQWSQGVTDARVTCLINLEKALDALDGEA
jgi:hypothetical protein